MLLTVSLKDTHDCKLVLIIKPVFYREPLRLGYHFLLYFLIHFQIITVYGNNSAWVHARICKLQKGWTRLAAASDKVYQLLVHGRWFSPGTPASSSTSTGRHDIAKILLKVALKHQKSNQIKSNFWNVWSNI